jgi:hypothetical protein
MANAEGGETKSSNAGTNEASATTNDQAKIEAATGN